MLRGLKVLFLTTVLPRKRRMGSEVASQAVIDALTELGADVTVVGYIRTDDDYSLGSGEVCAGKRHIETKGAGAHAGMWFMQSLLKRLPYSVAKYYSSAFVASVRKLMRQDNDLVIVDHVQMSWLIDAVPLRGKLIGMAHNVEHQMYQSFIGEQKSGVRRWVYQRESRLLREMEIAFANKVDQLWVLTQSDAKSFAVLKQNGSIKEIPLPGSAIPAGPTPVTKEFDIGMVGSWTWKANEEGLRWFFDRVYPHLPDDLTIHVAGSGAKWLDGRYGNVKYLGFVDDVQQFLQRARVIAIPTLSGGGIQIKTLDAIASGSQVVATPLALRGIDDHPPTLRAAEDAEQFARLLRSAVTSSDSAASAQAIEWSRLRRSRFMSEVAGSVQSLAH
jgi:polysaccharide biosynthesis protein PslH